MPWHEARFYPWGQGPHSPVMLWLWKVHCCFLQQPKTSLSVEEYPRWNWVKEWPHGQLQEDLNSSVVEGTCWGHVSHASSDPDPHSWTCWHIPDGSGRCSDPNQNANTPTPPSALGKMKVCNENWCCSHNSSGTSKTCFALSAHSSVPPHLVSWRKKSVNSVAQLISELCWKNPT